MRLISEKVKNFSLKCSSLLLLSTVFSIYATANVYATESSGDLNQQLQKVVTEYIGVGSNKPSLLKKIRALIAKGAQVHAVPAKEQMAFFATSMSPLSLAIYYKKVELVELFLTQKVDLTIPVSPTNGSTPLSYSIERLTSKETTQNDIKIVKLLLQHGANPNVIVLGGTHTPLDLAASQWQTDIVQLLLDAGADPNIRSRAEFTPLISKAAANTTMVKQLLAAGADANVRSIVGSTPLHFVCQRHYDLDWEPDPSAKVRIQMLMVDGTRLNALPIQKYPSSIGTAFNESLNSSNPDCVKAMLELGADLNVPLHTDTYYQHFPNLKKITIKEAIEKAVAQATTAKEKEMLESVLAASRIRQQATTPP